MSVCQISNLSFTNTQKNLAVGSVTTAAIVAFVIALLIWQEVMPGSMTVSYAIASVGAAAALISMILTKAPLKEKKS